MPATVSEFDVAGGKTVGLGATTPAGQLASAADIAAYQTGQKLQQIQQQIQNIINQKVQDLQNRMQKFQSLVDLINQANNAQNDLQRWLEFFADQGQAYRQFNPDTGQYTYVFTDQGAYNLYMQMVNKYKPLFDQLQQMLNELQKEGIITMNNGAIQFVPPAGWKQQGNQLVLDVNSVVPQNLLQQYQQLAAQEAQQLALADVLRNRVVTANYVVQFAGLSNLQLPAAILQQAANVAKAAGAAPPSTTDVGAAVQYAVQAVAQATQSGNYSPQLANELAKLNAALTVYNMRATDLANQANKAAQEAEKWSNVANVIQGALHGSVPAVVAYSIYQSAMAGEKPMSVISPDTLNQMRQRIDDLMQKYNAESNPLVKAQLAAEINELAAQYNKAVAQYLAGYLPPPPQLATPSVAQTPSKEDLAKAFNEAAQKELAQGNFWSALGSALANAGSELANLPSTAESFFSNLPNAVANIPSAVKSFFAPNTEQVLAATLAQAVNNPPNQQNWWSQKWDILGAFLGGAARGGSPAEKIAADVNMAGYSFVTAPLAGAGAVADFLGAKQVGQVLSQPYTSMVKYQPQWAVVETPVLKQLLEYTTGTNVIGPASIGALASIAVPIGGSVAAARGSMAGAELANIALKMDPLAWLQAGVSRGLGEAAEIAFEAGRTRLASILDKLSYLAQPFVVYEKESRIVPKPIETPEGTGVSVVPKVETTKVGVGLASPRIMEVGESKIFISKAEPVAAVGEHGLPAPREGITQPLPPFVPERVKADVYAVEMVTPSGQRVSLPVISDRDVEQAAKEYADIIKDVFIKGSARVTAQDVYMKLVSKGVPKPIAEALARIADVISRATHYTIAKDVVPELYEELLPKTVGTNAVEDVMSWLRKRGIYVTREEAEEIVEAGQQLLKARPLFEDTGEVKAAVARLGNIEYRTATTPAAKLWEVSVSSTTESPLGSILREATPFVDTNDWLQVTRVEGKQPFTVLRTDEDEILLRDTTKKVKTDTDVDVKNVDRTRPVDQQKPVGQQSSPPQTGMSPQQVDVKNVLNQAVTDLSKNLKPEVSRLSLPLGSAAPKYAVVQSGATPQAPGPGGGGGGGGGGDDSEVLVGGTGLRVKKGEIRNAMAFPEAQDLEALRGVGNVTGKIQLPNIGTAYVVEPSDAVRQRFGLTYDKYLAVKIDNKWYIVPAQSYNIVYTLENGVIQLAPPSVSYQVSSTLQSLQTSQQVAPTTSTVQTVAPTQAATEIVGPILPTSPTSSAATSPMPPGTPFPFMPWAPYIMPWLATGRDYYRYGKSKEKLVLY